MSKIQPIQREPLSTADREAQKALSVNATGGIRISGPAARVNTEQAAGQKVGGATSISGATGAPPSKTQGKVTK
jgi:hypothetical protein